MKVRMLLETLLMGGLIVGPPAWALAQEQDNSPPQVEDLDLEEVAVEPQQTEQILPDDEAETARPEPEPLATEPGEALFGAQGADDQNVEVSVQELQQLLNMPSGAMLKEWQEDLENPKSIFSTQEEIERIFDKNPKFIYFPDGVDPMVIPWVREKVIAEELYQEAMVAKGNRDFDKAKSLLRKIQEEFPNTTPGQSAQTAIAEIDKQIQSEIAQARAQEEPEETVQGPTPTPEPVTLPDWVRTHTTGILLNSEGVPVAIVGNDFLRPGDPVPRYSSVRVKSIAPSEVVYVYQDKEFPVDVVGAF